MPSLRELAGKRENIRREMRTIVDTHPGDLPAEAAARFTALEAEAEAVNQAEQREIAIQEIDKRAGGVALSDGRVIEPAPDAPFILRPETRVSDHLNRQAGRQTQELSVGKFIRGKYTGKWDGAETEKRLASEQSGSSGAFIIPDLVSPYLIDKIRNLQVMINAGAGSLVMPNEQLRVVQVTQDPVAYLKPEGEAIPESQGVFASLNLHAWTIGALVYASRELVFDAPTFSSELDLQLSKILALQLDSYAIYGNGSMQPTGILNTAGVPTVTLNYNSAGNGGYLVEYDDVLSLILQMQQKNADPSVWCMSPRTANTFSMMKDGLARYLGKSGQPDLVAKMRQVISNQFQNTDTVGSATTASSVILGGFENVALAYRTGIEIQVSQEAGEVFARGNVAFRALLRADVAVYRPTQLGVLNGILGGFAP